MTLQDTKDVAEAREQSVQPRANQSTHTGITGLLYYLSAGSRFYKSRRGYS